MIPLNYLYTIQCLVAFASADIHRRWTNTDIATGNTGGTIIEGCEYWVNDIGLNDSCEAIESYFGITEKQFLSWNPSVPYSCTLVRGWSYCVAGPENPVISGSTTSTSTAIPAGTLTYSGTVAPTQSGITSRCTKYYEVQDNDTCYTIQDKFMGFTLDQFYSWNPSISKGCKGLESHYFVCISDGSSPASSSATATTTSSSAGHEPHQTGIPSDCNKWYYVVDGDTCETIAKEHDMTKEEFYNLNPATGSTCGSLWLNNYVCVGEGFSPISTSVTTTAISTSLSTTTGYNPHQTGIPSDCNKWHYVIDGDTCETIAKEYDMTKEEFYQLNPATGSTCGSLWLDNYVCVGVLKTSSTSATSIKSTTTRSAPSPTGSGTVEDCVDFYKVQSGDSCWSIVNEKYTYLTQALFTKWNPSVGNGCTIFLDQYYCVAIKTAQPMPGTIDTCKTWHLAASEDGCWSIEQEYGITAAQFNAWNPKVGSDCANLWLGYYMCVGI